MSALEQIRQRHILIISILGIALLLFILTAVDHVCLNFGTPEQRALDELHVDEAETYLRAGQFGAGSMQPKVAAAVQFVRSGWRRRAVIASLEQAPAAMRGESGTRIVP